MELRTILGGELPDRPNDAGQVIDELVRDASDGILGNSTGRFFGWVYRSGELLDAESSFVAIAGVSPQTLIIDQQLHLDQRGPIRSRHPRAIDHSYDRLGRIAPPRLEKEDPRAIGRSMVPGCQDRRLTPESPVQPPVSRLNAGRLR